MLYILPIRVVIKDKGMGLGEAFINGFIQKEGNRKA